MFLVNFQGLVFCTRHVCCLAVLYILLKSIFVLKVTPQKVLKFLDMNLNKFEELKLWTCKTFCVTSACVLQILFESQAFLC